MPAAHTLNSTKNIMMMVVMMMTMRDLVGGQRSTVIGEQMRYDWAAAAAAVATDRSSVKWVCPACKPAEKKCQGNSSFALLNLLLASTTSSQTQEITRSFLGSGLTRNILECSLALNVTAPLLWSPYVIGQTIIFLPCDFYLSFFFLLSFFIPRLISAAVDWMSTILPQMVWP